MVVIGYPTNNHLAMIENQLKDLDVWFGNGIPDDQGVLSCCKSVCLFFFWIGVITPLSICPSRRIFIYHLWLVFFHSWGWLVKQVWVWRKPWKRKLSRMMRRLMTDFEPSTAAKCQDSRDRVPWAVATEAEATFHSFWFDCVATWEVFSRWWHHASVSLLMPAEWNSQISQNVKKTWRQLRLLPWHHRKKKQLQDLKLHPENQRGLVRFLHFPYSSRSLWYILLITYSWNLLTCNLDHLPHFTQMEAPGKFSERSDIPQHYVTTFPTSVDEVERFTGAFP